jgi:uncharacterized phage infection (PIP) family protein YhgE
VDFFDGIRYESGDKMMTGRYHVLIRTLMFLAYALIVLASVVMNGNGAAFGLSVKNSNGLMIFLFVTCAINAVLVVIFDKATRVIAVIVLLTLLVLLPSF